MTDFLVEVYDKRRLSSGHGFGISMATVKALGGMNVANRLSDCASDVTKTHLTAVGSRNGGLGMRTRGIYCMFRQPSSSSYPSEDGAVMPTVEASIRKGTVADYNELMAKLGSLVEDEAVQSKVQIRLTEVKRADCHGAFAW